MAEKKTKARTASSKKQTAKSVKKTVEGKASAGKTSGGTKTAAKKTTVKKTTAKKTAAKAPAAKKASSKAVKSSKKKLSSKKSSENKARLSANSEFFNRELSWLEFNDRILHEARDTKNPLLERLNFLSITASNLDEFYIVRVASLRDMESAEMESLDIAGLTVKEQLRRIDQKTRESMNLMYSTFNRSLIPALKSEHIHICEYSELNERMKQEADDYFRDVLYPIVTPMAVDASRPFPLIYNRMLNMCIMLDGEGSVLSARGKDKKGSGDEGEHSGEGVNFATLQIPTVVPRLHMINSEDGEIYFVPVEQIIKANLDMLFFGQKVISSACYRVMRNADLDIDEDEAEDLLKEIEEQVRRRRFGEIIRLEIEDDMSDDILKFITEELEIEKGDIFKVNGPIDLTFLSKVNSALDPERFKDLRYPKHIPAAPSMFDESLDNIFDQIREKDRIVHHPYESFDPVLEFVRQAATDPNVLAIKQTLYRVSSRSPIIASLLEAARNGKQVMVLVELKARFDEENNINWAKMLENAGCHVIYGLVGLKTHSKITLVVRKEEDGIRRYLHLATGNYNDITAKIYTDLGMFTASESMGEDASEFFNMLSGFSIPMTWRRLIPAPIWLKDYFVRKIRIEAENAQAGKKARIVAKINSLVDGTMIRELYKASQAGVKIDLIVRGICCLRAGVQGMSENISVRSITGRFLEHSRIFYFYNEGHEDLYLASADWMPRNLDRRVELMFPVEDPDCRRRVMEVLEVELNDTVRAHILNEDGTYHKPDLRGKVKVDSQEKLIELANAAVASRYRNYDNMAFIPAESAY
ncbi:MAG: RNA degradosome polyphosphate kinase [Clostridiales bacterium]|nr:RNA degradosome polyphosphate kinase [Clostridiales bacterium]